MAEHEQNPLEELPHPVCGHIRPRFAHRVSGPCDWCLLDIDREYTTKVVTWDEIRGRRRPLLEETDWVDINPGRVSREAPEYVQAVRDYRQALFDITITYTDPEDVMWPAMPGQ